jgi:uncharacterized Zn finger protein
VSQFRLRHPFLLCFGMGNLTWRGLTWEDLEAWAGAKSLKKGRSYRSQVGQLAQTPAGGYLAWVDGSQRYITHVEINKGQLESDCTCPVGKNCKHAVAVVLVGLEAIKNKQIVATAGDGDPRWLLLEPPHISQLEPPSPAQNSLETYVAGLPEPKLRDLLDELVARFASVRQLLQDRANRQGADGQTLLRQAKKQIAKLGNISDYDYHAIPDTDQLTNALKALHEGQHFDALLGLAPSLMQASNHAIESCHDEGDLHESLRGCFDLVIDALPQCSLGRGERLIWLEQLTLDDEYELIDASAKDDEFWQDNPPQQEDWQALSEHFSLQLKNTDVKHYCRSRIGDLVSFALERAGRKGEITALLEQEAEQHGEYLRLVEHYIELGQLQKADAAIVRGLERNRQDPRIGGHGLQQKWRALRQQEKNWAMLTSDSAEAFLRHPNVYTFDQLQNDAQKAKLWKTIYPLARAFLETGKVTLSEWGLVVTGLPQDGKKMGVAPAPHTQTLLALAIKEKNVGGILRWYKPSNRFGYGTDDDAVAAVLADAYPERALQIWVGLVEGLVAQTGQSNYIQSMDYLKKIRAVYQKNNQDAQWETLLEQLYTTHRRKPRFIELLQGLRGKSIVET